MLIQFKVPKKVGSNRNQVARFATRALLLPDYPDRLSVLVSPLRETLGGPYRPLSIEMKKVCVEQFNRLFTGVHSRHISTPLITRDSP